MVFIGVSTIIHAATNSEEFMNPQISTRTIHESVHLVSICHDETPVIEVTEDLIS